MVGLAAAMNGCGDEADVYYNVINGQESASLCPATCERLYACAPTQGYSANDCTVFCEEKDLPSVAPKWISCILEKPCTNKLKHECEPLIEGTYD